MDKLLIEDLQATGFIHRPLTIHEEDSLENAMRKKPVLKSLLLTQGSSGTNWTHSGPGTLELLPPSSQWEDGGAIRLESPTVMDHWPEGAPEDGDYSNFGTVAAILKIDHQDWEEFNRLSFSVHPHLDGVRNVHLSIAFKNEGEQKLPDPYHREGIHVVNLENRKRNSVVIEIAELPRDCITELYFYYFMNGKDISTGELMRYEIGSIRLEKVEEVEVTYGWMPKNGQIVYSSTGYASLAQKTAIASKLDLEDFEVIDADSKEVVFSGKVQRIQELLGDFFSMDFSEVKKPGRYQIRSGDSCTDAFVIDNDLWLGSVWKVINFLFCERCGYPVPNKHGSCHRDVLATHKGKAMVFNGGWHDAGDVSQQLLQTAEITHVLFEAAESIKQKDYSLYLRLIEEGEWGLDFMLKTRFGDGYRATSAGITIWSEGFIGDLDDMKARVHNHAYENFMCAGMEAYISMVLPGDAMLRERLEQCAKQDFDFAVARFGQTGFEEKPIFWEHSYMTSESQFMAGAAFSAAMLYQLTQDSTYADKAVEYIDYVLECQCSVPVGEQYQMSGFFYRNKEKKVIQHFNHQSREHLYMQALLTVSEALPRHRDASKWLQAMKAYGEYIKGLMEFTKPYGMLPSGIYNIHEAQDESFGLQHLLIDDQAKIEFVEQLKNGIKLDDEHYLKRFPVWFSFRGNTAVHLSMGKAAALCGRKLLDDELLEIAEQQLQWTVGKNPFGQSLMYGEGTRFAQQYAILPGEMVGELPVGVQTKGNEDVPYYPSLNHATYKEVWTTSAAKWLAIVSELQGRC